MTVKVLKLTSGEEIIGTTLAYAESDTIIKKPIVIQIAMDENGEPQVGMGIYCPLSDEDQLRIRNDAILFSYKPVAQLLNQYQSMTGGLLTPAGPGLILPS